MRHSETNEIVEFQPPDNFQCHIDKMTLKSILLSERSQILSVIHCVILFIGHSEKGQIIGTEHGPQFARCWKWGSS